jgi:hypothetical protein
VWRRPGGYILIHDEFVGNGSHEIEVNFQFAPGHLAEVPGASGGAVTEGRVDFEDFAQLAWMGTGEWRTQVRCGGDGPADGWICRSLGVRVPAPRLTLTAATQGAPVSLLTVVADRAIDVVPILDGPATLLRLSRDAQIDWVAASGLTQGGAMETDGRLAICRVVDGVEVEREVAHGLAVRVDHARLARLAAPAPVAVRR